MIRSVRLPVASVSAVVLALIVAACGSSATATPTPTPNTGGLGGLPSGLGGSGDLLGGLGLHGNPGLEARLPSQVCGAAATRMSVAPGALPAAALGALGGNAGLLSGLGGTVTFSFALAGPGAAASDPCDTTFFALQVQGGDANNILQAMVASNTSDGGSSSTASLGGKNVTVVTSSGGSKTYAYVNGDTVFAVSAADDATAAAALFQMP